MGPYVLGTVLSPMMLSSIASKKNRNQLRSVLNDHGISVTANPRAFQSLANTT